MALVPAGARQRRWALA